MLVQRLNMKCHEDLFGSSRVVTCGHMDEKYKTNSIIATFSERAKNRLWYPSNQRMAGQEKIGEPEGF
jgi:hypothetical protein